MSFTPPKNIIIVGLEGNIGAGKSTLVRFLKTQHFNRPVLFLEEPVDEWNTIKDETGVTALEHFYEDKSKYSFAFQMMAYISRLASIKKLIETVTPGTIIVTERSLQTDKNVFEKMLHKEGHINTIEHQIYGKWFDAFSDVAKLTHIVYLSTTPETSFTRIQKRNRTGETGIPLDYLKKCDEYHKDWIMHFETPTLILDGDKDINTNINYFKDTCDAIMKFLGLAYQDSDMTDTQWLTGC
jgi:deoxyadenosine/deoxycytidine kinase